MLVLLLPGITLRHEVLLAVCKTRNCPFKALDEGLRETLKSFSEMLLDYMKLITPAFHNPYHGH